MIIHKKRKRILCKNAQELSLKLYDFIDHVSSVQEESMTEYLIWQWEILNAKVKFFKHRKLHTKIEEAKSGADFELELWILDEKNAVPFMIQAKKIIEPYKRYCQESLNYNNKKLVKQYQLLIDMATFGGKKYIPLYMFYTKNAKDKSIYIADAHKIKEMAEECDKKLGTMLSRDEILDISYNIIDLFCPPSSESRGSVNPSYDNFVSNYKIELENLGTQKFSHINQYLKEGIITEHNKNIVIVDLRQIQ